MSIHRTVTKQELIDLYKLAEQPKHQRAEENRKRKLEQTQDIKLAENTLRITKKLQKLDESTQKVEVLKISNLKTKHPSYL